MIPTKLFVFDVLKAFEVTKDNWGRFNDKTSFECQRRKIRKALSFKTKS